MNYTLIMLDIPVLVSDEFDERGRKIIAGFFGLPKLDLSLIADEIGWVDVYKLAKESKCFENSSLDETSYLHGFTKGFKAAQSLNEKKFALAYVENAFNSGRGYGNPDDIKDFNSFLQSISKPKEYNVKVEMEWGGKEYVDEQDAYGYDIKRPKITNNTIKVTKIIK